MEKTITKTKFNQLCVLEGTIMPDGAINKPDCYKN